MPILRGQSSSSQKVSAHALPAPCRPRRHRLPLRAIRMTPGAESHAASRSRDLLVGVLVIQVLFTLIAAAAIAMDPQGVVDSPAARLLAGALIFMPIAIAALLAVRFYRSHRSERTRARVDAQMMDMVMSTSREWLWAVDDQGIYTFCGPASEDLVGYSPSELVGEHCSLVMDLDYLGLSFGIPETQVRENPERDLMRCRHRDGSTVWLETAARASQVDGRPDGGLEGASRPVADETAREAAAALSRERIRAIIDGRKIVTAFQPIYGLATGHLLGVEALSRFLGDGGAGPEYWFREAAEVGLAAELELAAMQTALDAARKLPPGVYVSLNASPETCLDPRLHRILERCWLPLDRIVLELTERLEVVDYGPLVSVLAPLRRRGLRIAVDDAGSGFASMRHVLQTRPDIIKLDRSLIAGIHEDLGQQALCAAMAEFGRHIGATLTAEGIETESELAAVTDSGMTAGQGYFLGRPSTIPVDWAAWGPQTEKAELT